MRLITHPAGVRANLEHELRSELKNTRWKRAGDLPKTGGSCVVYSRVIPVCVVEDVKRIGLELQLHAFHGQRELLPQRHVPLIEVGTDDVADRGITRAKVACRAEGTGVRPANRKRVRAGAAK